MFRAASFGGQFALLVARHLYFLFFVIIVLFHLANKICSVLFFPLLKWGFRGDGKCRTGKWRTKSQGMENAGLEYDGPNRKAWKCRTGKWRTTLYTKHQSIRPLGHSDTYASLLKGPSAYKEPYGRNSRLLDCGSLDLGFRVIQGHRKLLLYRKTAHSLSKVV